MTASHRASVLCFSGHDPGGGAGIHADIESIAAAGGHAFTVITAHTVQDTANVHGTTPALASLMTAQVDALLADSEIGAIKIGLLGDSSQIPVILSAIARTRVPVVLDPVLRAGGGALLAGAELQAAMQAQLFPLTTVLTPNAAEARRLAPEAGDLDACGAALLTSGVKNVLITGGDEPALGGGDGVVNTWHAPRRPLRRFVFSRLPNAFHGAGCTLAAAIAVRLAQKLPLAQALEDAQVYTHRALTQAISTGKGRSIPRRIRDL